MSKQGINPVTLRPLASHPGLSLTAGRMHIGTAENMLSLVTFALSDEKSKKVEGGATIGEKEFVEAMGHLFPHGELKDAHLTAEEAKTASENYAALLLFVTQIAGMTKDGETDPDNPDDEDGYVMENDDNFDTMMSLIGEARALIGQSDE